MKIINALILLLITTGHAFAASTDANNDQQEYDVEIIIFEDAHARYINNETWNQNSHGDTAISETNGNENELAAPAKVKSINATRQYKNIKPGILSSEYKRINGSSEYKVLRYSAWRQVGLSEDKAFDINIDELENAHTTKSENSIIGTLKVVLARYLHLYGELEYIRDQPMSLQNNASITTDNFANNQSGNTELSPEQTQVARNRFPIQIQRRMRSKELHYIDHPLVGILVQINPVDKKQ